MTRPLDRNARLPQAGKVDTEGGEFWVENPFQMTGSGFNLSAYERNRLYLNLGGDFIDASFASAADIDADSRAAVAADFDRDGAPDLLVVSVGGGPLRLFLSRFPARPRLRLELEGAGGRTAIGARVIARSGELRQVRDLFPVNGGMGQGPAELYLGLGPAEQIDELRVIWPSGREQVFPNVVANASLRVREGESEIARSPLRPASELSAEAVNGEP